MPSLTCGNSGPCMLFYNLMDILIAFLSALICIVDSYRLE